MEPQEIHELAEKAARRKEKGIGLTTAILAVLLAVVTMMAHRSHTEEVVLQTRAADQWSYYQAKNIRRHMYAADKQLAQALGAGGGAAAAGFQRLYAHEMKKLPAVMKDAQRLEAEALAISYRADFYDVAEIFFELAVVLCSIALLAEQLVYWRFSMLSGVLGIGIAVIGLLRH